MHEFSNDAGRRSQIVEQSEMAGPVRATGRKTRCAPRRENPEARNSDSSCKECGGPGSHDEKDLEARRRQLAHKDPLICGHVRRDGLRENDHEDHPLRALLLLDKESAQPCPSPAPPRPAGSGQAPGPVRSDRMEAARVEGGEVAATSAGILRDASALPDDPEEPARLRDGPRVVGREGQPEEMIPWWAWTPLWPLLEGWSCGATARASRSPVSGRPRSQARDARILSEADKTLPRRAPPERVRDACQAGDRAMVTHYQIREDPGDDGRDRRGGVAGRAERPAIVRRLAGRRLRTIIRRVPGDGLVVDACAGYAEMMRKRSSRAGDFHAKVCGSLDRAESAERKRGSPRGRQSHEMA